MIQEEESRRLVMKEHIQVFTKNTLDGLTQELKITTSESRYYVLLAPQFGQKVSVSGINTPQFLHDVLITTTSRMTSFSWVAACALDWNTWISVGRLVTSGLPSIAITPLTCHKTLASKVWKVGVPVGGMFVFSGKVCEKPCVMCNGPVAVGLAKYSVLDS